MLRIEVEECCKEVEGLSRGEIVVEVLFSATNNVIISEQCQYWSERRERDD